jgi:p-aminobenzoyl-glutamate transporter AbgT
MLRWSMTIVLIIIVWFAVAFCVGCRLGKFIHDSQNHRGEQHNEIQGQVDKGSERSTKHVHHTKEINHDSRKARIEHGERTH